ncbi:uncharacterized Rossmann fold enzyme [Cenarchaeum symbiosum A]|uniref:6-hydroxymethyl-7,8-dihydropterin pyrophosphokinase n=1 Tax=Cenarchaeum symbiosum (strain A) TaxID=414004 RepID=A0RZ43_CENSY|nr:uncharacterized Rossmann fold enzyme [Cenarchaeum symbiosum A]
MIRGWAARYRGILAEFGYSAAQDRLSAKELDGIIGRPVPLGRIAGILRGKTVLVVGAGPSLHRALKVIPGLDLPIIASDGALRGLLDEGIMPDIITTDLDGDTKSLLRAGRSRIMIVHAHGDNIERLPMVRSFGNVLGTTQGRELGRLYNFGGFTDGDRAVFLAEALGARKIVLAGMDLGSRIGSLSDTRPADRATKIKKLKRARVLLEWLAGWSRATLYTTSGYIRGFERVRLPGLAP